VGAQTEVGSAAAEADVLVALAADVEAERVVEETLVAVVRGEPERDAISLGDRDPGAVGVPRGDPLEVGEG
jgi:hypothetical protein